jgi:hypothetical protein
VQKFRNLYAKTDEIMEFLQSIYNPQTQEKYVIGTGYKSIPPHIRPVILSTYLHLHVTCTSYHCYKEQTYSAHKINAHLVYKVAELSHPLVLAWQHAGDSGHHPPSSFSLSSQLYMQEVSHKPANTVNSGTLFYANEMWYILWYICWSQQKQPWIGNGSAKTTAAK